MCKSFSRWLQFWGLMFAFSAIQLHAQTATLLPMTQASWLYYQAGDQPPDINGVRWFESNYVDTAWSSGFGLFGFETDATYPDPINTPLDLIAPGAGTNTIAYYFRTHFEYPTNPAGAELIFTLGIDDGLAVYLNGSILLTNRLVANATYNTLAAGRTVPEGRYEYTNIINSPLLRQGDNVLAVKVHQSATNSTDLIFGLALAASFPEPITITKQPQGGAVAIGESLNLSVEVGGTHPQFQWFRNGTAISGVTGSNYNVLIANTANSGNYFVRAWNGISTNDSTQITIQMVRDTVSPEPVSAIVYEGSPNQIILTFTDKILRVNFTNFNSSSTNVANYSVQVVGQTGTNLVTSAITTGSSTDVRLTMAENWDRSKDYFVTINRISDTDTNIIRHNAQIGVSFRTSTNLIAASHCWSWTAMFQSNLPPNWMCASYREDPFLWASTCGPFYYETDNRISPCMGPVFNGSGNGTQISIGYDTYYFRTKFVVPTNIVPAETALRFTYMIDDGAIFYLNCNEIFRTNMPPWAPAYNMRANLPFEDDICRSQDIRGTYLLPGTNTLAVEVHQYLSPMSDFDIAFGAILDAVSTNGLRIPALQFRKLPTDALALTWTGSGWTLEQNAVATTNGWATVPTAGNAYTNTAPVRFFRLRKR